MNANELQGEREAFEGLSAKLWCDLRTDEERSAWLLLGRGYETGVVARALQNDLAMAYHRLALLSAATPSAVSAEARMQINLSKEQAELLGLFLTASEDPPEMVLGVGPGHSGYGLYVWEAEYPEEGATFIAAMTDPADPFGDKDLPLDSHERADRDRAAMAPPADNKENGNG